MQEQYGWTGWRWAVAWGGLTLLQPVLAAAEPTPGAALQPAAMAVPLLAGAGLSRDSAEILDAAGFPDAALLAAALPPALPEEVGPSAPRPVLIPPEFQPGYPLFPEPEPPPDRLAPPRLLSRDTKPDSPVFSLIPAPSLATGEPIPGAGAGHCLRRDQHGRFIGGMVRQHCVFSGRALVTARWVDDFFGDWHDDEAALTARLVSHMTWTESEGVDQKVTLRASALLPNARRRIRLIITDETEEDLRGQQLQRQLGQDDSRMSAAVSWVSLDTPALRSRVDVGVRGISPMDMFLRYRLGKVWSLTQDSLIRTTHTLRYGSDSKERYTPTLDYERALDENSVFRLSNYYDYRHYAADEGFNWTHSVSLSHTLHDRQSMAYGLSLSGPTRPEWRGESWGPWLIYRRPFLRPWLYYELEPHYTWDRDRDWDGRASIVLRLEVQFGYRP